MVIITLTDCPPALRGDLSKWLQEINTGVYVGRISARVREELWNRVRENIKNGHATMVFNTNNEQGMDFRVHNSQWDPIDFDGLKLMLRPSQSRSQNFAEIKHGFSKAAKYHMSKKMSANKANKQNDELSYIVVDVETTGLLVSAHEIIEIGALKVKGSRIIDEFQVLVDIGTKLPKEIENLTGITDKMLKQEGRDIAVAMKEFLNFAGNLPFVMHNADFDYKFLRAACEKCHLSVITNKTIDTLSLARKLIEDVRDYKLETLMEYFRIKSSGGNHRSMNDCLNTKDLYEKLINLYQD